MNGHLQGSYAGDINPTLILLSHEACLHINGHVKSQNKVYWSAENPMVIHTHCHYMMLRVMCVVLQMQLGLLGPLFFRPEIHTNT